MNSISKFLEKKLLPIATVVANNTYIQVLSQTFISLIPIIIIGYFRIVIFMGVCRYCLSLGEEA